MCVGVLEEGKRGLCVGVWMCGCVHAYWISVAAWTGNKTIGCDLNLAGVTGLEMVDGVTPYSTLTPFVVSHRWVGQGY